MHKFNTCDCQSVDWRSLSTDYYQMAEEQLTVQLRFGQRLREIRRLSNTSQEQLANRAGLDRTYISLLERGLRNPSLECIERLAKALDVTINDLCNI